MKLSLAWSKKNWSLDFLESITKTFSITKNYFILFIHNLLIYQHQNPAMAWKSNCLNSQRRLNTSISRFVPICYFGLSCSKFLIDNCNDYTDL